MVQDRWVRQLTVLVPTMVSVIGIVFAGCARMPYTTKVVHEDQRVAVMLQQEVESAGYAHPTQIDPQEVAAILRGYSLRKLQRLPLRWFAEEAPPIKIFREDELEVLAPQLADALRKAAPAERVYFEVFAPGLNPKYRRDVTGGWVAIQDRFFHLTMDYFHVQQPLTSTDPYYLNYPEPWSPPTSYLLYFEPGRFYMTDPKTDTRGVDFKEFLKTSPLP